MELKVLVWGWRGGGEVWAVVGARRRVVKRKIAWGLGRCMVRIVASLGVLLLRREEVPIRRRVAQEEEKRIQALYCGHRLSVELVAAPLAVTGASGILCL